MDVRTEHYITPNSQWNNEGCLYGSHSVAFIPEPHLLSLTQHMFI